MSEMADQIRAIWRKAPAKINRFLHITGQRADGYHCLQSVFQCIELADELTFSNRDDGNVTLSITLDSPLRDILARQLGQQSEAKREDALAQMTQQLERDNLCLRAARLMQSAYQETITSEAKYPGVDIQLIKRIPIGGGLGGGSSNAATTLMALNDLWQMALSQAKLRELGPMLGADVSYFLQPSPAWVEGVGELITPISPTILPSVPIMMIFPTVSISTAQIYADAHLVRDKPECDKNIVLKHIADSSASEPQSSTFGSFDNVMQPVVIRHYPELAEIAPQVQAYLPDADVKMSGSGSSFFVVLPRADHAAVSQLQIALEAQGFAVLLTNTLTNAHAYAIQK